MKVVSEDEVRLELDAYVHHLEKSLFVYPTDTVYGIGCNALDERLVMRLREVKQQIHRPFSVIVPSLEWVKQNCVITDRVRTWMERLPGPYTLIVKLKNPEAIAWNVNMGKDTLGIRLPDCWITELITKMGVPIVTTSANLQGGDVMVTLDDLHHRIAESVDLTIYSTPLRGKPSTLVFLENEELIQERQ